MNMTLHHQKIRRLPDGRQIKIGEDGRPYAKDGILIVADGLGGRGGFPHSKINRQLLDRDYFFETAFGKDFEGADEDFMSFVLDSFSEFFDLKDVYFTSPSAMRTSGYFASRLVTAIVLYELKTNPQYERNTLLSKLKSLDSATRGEELRHLSEGLAETIRVKLERFAERMGLVLESKTRGSYLLPSTLVIALAEEHDEDVDVLYLWAGDSRGYLWDTDGLAQITDDHEQNETMTNLITLTKPFAIEARLLTVKKPVVLFNASDGCYKCPCFSSPLDLEYSLLQGFAGADGFEKASELLDGTFAEIGTHDDSNTIALASFGYADYTALLVDIQKRMDSIKETYISKMPDFFERDYSAEAEQLEGQKDGILFTMKGKLMNMAEGRRFVVELMKAKYNELYEETLAKSKEELIAFDAKRTGQTAKVEHWVKWYWLREPCLRLYSEASDAKYNKTDTPYERCAELERKIRSCRAEYKKCQDAILHYCDTADRLLESCTSYCDTVSIYGISKSQIRQYIWASRESLQSMKLAIKQKMRLGREIFDAESELDHIFAVCFAKEEGIIKAFVDKILSDAEFLNKIEMSESCRATINSYLSEIRDGDSVRQELERNDTALEEKCVQKFWSDHAMEIVDALVMSEVPLEELKELAKRVIEIDKNLSDVNLAIEQREQLYAEYLVQYNRMFEESKL